MRWEAYSPIVDWALSGQVAINAGASELSRSGQRMQIRGMDGFLH
jgi:hypothetical protein